MLAFIFSVNYLADGTMSLYSVSYQTSHSSLSIIIAYFSVARLRSNSTANESDSMAMIVASS